MASLAARARAARVRSAVTAASSSEVSAAVAMNSCVASRLSVIESRTNGPSSWAVFQTVIEQTTTIAVAAPRGPKPQCRPEQHGEDDVGDVALGRNLGQHAQHEEPDRALDQVAAADATHP